MHKCHNLNNLSQSSILSLDIYQSLLHFNRGFFRLEAFLIRATNILEFRFASRVVSRYETAQMFRRQASAGRQDSGISATVSKLRQNGFPITLVPRLVVRAPLSRRI